MKLKTAIPYYLTSIPTMFKGGIRINHVLSVIMGKESVIGLKNGLKFRVSTLMDIWTLKETVLDDVYQQLHIVSEGDLVIDIGLAFGDFSILVSKKAKKVVSFDCNSEIFTLAKKNISMNKCINITAICKRVNSLDEIFTQYKIDHCNFLKIDCEGCEYQLLLNASKKTLNQIDFIAMEVHFFDHEMEINYQLLLKMLRSANFTIVQNDNPVHESICYLFAKRMNL
jgi:tRNA G37 N-methylase Trm5